MKLLVRGALAVALATRSLRQGFAFGLSTAALSNAAWRSHLSSYSRFSSAAASMDVDGACGSADRAHCATTSLRISRSISLRISRSHHPSVGSRQRHPHPISQTPVLHAHAHAHVHAHVRLSTCATCNMYMCMYHQYMRMYISTCTRWYMCLDLSACTCACTVVSLR